MATKTYLYRASGVTAAQLGDLLAAGASPVVGSIVNEDLTPITIDDSHKTDLDEAMASLGYGFVSEYVGPAMQGRKDYGVLPSDPAGPPAPAVGDYYYNSTNQEDRVYDGVSWSYQINGAAPQVLTNKRYPVATVSTTPFNPTDDDHYMFVDATTGNVTVNLPAATTRAGHPYYIKKVDATANTVSVVANGSDKLDGLSSRTLTTQYESIEIVSDGVTNWYIVG